MDQGLNATADWAPGAPTHVIFRHEGPEGPIDVGVSFPVLLKTLAHLNGTPQDEVEAWISVAYLHCTRGSAGLKALYTASQAIKRGRAPEGFEQPSLPWDGEGSDAALAATAG